MEGSPWYLYIQVLEKEYIPRQSQNSEAALSLLILFGGYSLDWTILNHR